MPEPANIEADDPAVAARIAVHLSEAPDRQEMDALLRRFSDDVIPQAVWRLPAVVTAVSFDADNRHVLTEDGPLRADGRGDLAAVSTHRLPCGVSISRQALAAVPGLAWSPDHQRLAVVRDDGSVHVLCPGEQPTELRVPEAEIVHVAWSPDGGRLLTLTRDGRVHVWSLAIYRGRHAAWSRDGRRFAMTVSPRRAARGKTEVWEIAAGTPPARRFALVGERPDFGPDGKILTLIPAGVGVWSRDGRSEATLVPPRPAEGRHGYDPRIADDARFSPDGSHIVLMMSYHGHGYIFRTDGTGPASFLAPNGVAPPERLIDEKVRSVDWSGDGRWLAAVLASGSLRLVPTDGDGGVWTGREPDWPQPGYPMDAAWSADGARVLIMGWSGRRDEGRAEVRVWNPESGAIFSVPPHTKWLENALISPDHRWVLTEDRGGHVDRVRLWRTDGPLELAAGAPIEQAAWSADGERVVMAGPGGTLIARRACERRHDRGPLPDDLLSRP